MVIFDILFNKWWTRALMKPAENGLLTNCEPEVSFVRVLKEAIRVLKLVFSNKTISSYTIMAFINSKR